MDKGIGLKLQSLLSSGLGKEKLTPLLLSCGMASDAHAILPMIKCEDLKIHYGDHVAVDSLSFEVTSGSVYGLIGPNGAGKTTTIKAIATLIEPTYGEIFVDHIPVLHQPEEARKIIGYMPDFPPVYDELRVEEFCDLFAHAYGLESGARARKVEECLRLTDLLDKRRALCKTLSRGMKQRALLAKTLVHDPSVLLLDEPAANLDPKARIDLRNLLRRLASSGKTVLVSSHVLTELEDLCDAIGIMNQGNMALSGSLEEVTASASTSASQVILLELAEPFPNLENLLSDSPSVSRVEARDEAARIFEITHPGDKSAAATLLTSLTGAGAKVCGFHLKQSKVEDLFLEIEAKGTSKETGL